MILFRLDTLQLIQEKEKKLSGSVFYWVIQKRFLRVYALKLELTPTSSLLLGMNGLTKSLLLVILYQLRAV